MIYKNTIKILFSNFSLVWKMMLYFLLVFAVSGGLLFMFINPILKTIESAGFFESFVDLYSSFVTNLDIPVFFQNLSSYIDNLLQFMLDNISTLWFWFLGIVFVSFFLISFLLSLANMAICNSLHLYIGSMNKQGFFTSFGECFGKSLKFQTSEYQLSGIGRTRLYNVFGNVHNFGILDFPKMPPRWSEYGLIVPYYELNFFFAIFT